LAWQNDDLILFHGCTNLSLHPRTASGIKVGSLPHGINHQGGATRPDFGPGFYATTWLHQAKNWANLRVRKVSRRHRPAVAIVLRFAMKRNDLADLQDLVFLTDRGDYFPFVGYCRAGGMPHAPTANRKGPYDIVYGPVSLVHESLTVKDCDQISFHTALATSKIPMVSIEARGNPLFRDVIP
jgi:Protein of unknown function (DUF3990)